MIRVRPAAEADRPALVRILRETFLADQARYIPGPLDPASVERHSQALVSEHWKQMALAELDGEPVGMVYVNGAKIEAANVLPAHQRQGIGTALMLWAEVRIEQGGHHTAALDVGSPGTELEFAL